MDSLSIKEFKIQGKSKKIPEFKKFISSKNYSKALDSLVFACVDIILRKKNGSILLGKRTRYPILDWWILGGRMLSGEKIKETASRVIKRETGIRLSPVRFKQLPFVYTILNAKRHQEPKENGSHVCNFYVTVFLNKKEGPIKKIEKEYSEIKWVQPEDILSGRYPRLLKNIIKDFIKSE